MIRYFNCTVTGNSHERDGTACQDRHLVKTSQSPLFFGVSDGAGSCSHSGEGAGITLEQTYKWLCDHPQSGEPSDLLESVRGRLQEHAEQNNLALKDLSATLLFVFIEAGNVKIGQIGDGIMGYRRGGGSMKKVFEEQKGEFANETIFVTSDTRKINFQTAELTLDEHEPLEIVLMSDGIESVLYNKRGKYFATAVDKFFEWARNGSYEEVNEGVKKAVENAIKPQTQDDLSIVGCIYSYEKPKPLYIRIFNSLKNFFNKIIPVVSG